ncbi:MAG: hypothetical protein V2A61_03790 [Calditrichota bacterium]
MMILVAARFIAPKKVYHSIRRDKSRRYRFLVFLTLERRII